MDFQQQLQAIIELIGSSVTDTAQQASIKSKLDELGNAHSAKVTSVNNEAKGLRTRLKDLEIMEARIKAFANKDAIDLSDVDALIESGAKLLTAEQKLELANRTAANDKKLLDESNNAILNMQRTERESKRDKAIISGLGSLGLKSEAMPQAQKLVSMESEWDESTSGYLFRGKPLNEFLETFKSENPYMVGNPIKRPGDGGGPAGGGQGNPDFVSREQFLAMSAEERKAPEMQAKIKASVPKWELDFENR
jgi:hypothetical protein